MSSVVDWQDRNTAVLFGDGASAAVRAVSDCVETILADWSCQSNTLAPIQEYFFSPKSYFQKTLALRGFKMKKAFFHLACLGAVVVSSASVVADPVVRCEMRTQKNDIAKFVQIEATKGAGTEATESGYTLKAQIEPIAAAGSRPMPIIGYQLHVTISSDTLGQSYASVEVGKKNSRLSAALIKTSSVDEALVNCDVISE